MHKSFGVLLLLLFSYLAPEAGTAINPKGFISGTIRDTNTQKPLPGATISIIDSHLKTLADKDGKFIFRGLSPGAYQLEISHIGYETLRQGIVVIAGDTVIMANNLIPHPIPLKNITVTPDTIDLMGIAPIARQTLKKQEIGSVPQLGEDLFRAVARLPGLTGNDISTRFMVRGGKFDEILVTLDGLQLYRPFHLKDLDGGAISIIDVAAVEGIDLLTGAFPADYGDKMSGVLDIRSREVPPDRSRVSVGLSLTNLRALAEGYFGGRKGSWIVSMRRGYLDYLLRFTEDGKEVVPKYHDVFAKLQYHLGSAGILAVHLLHAADKIEFRGAGQDAGSELFSRYKDSYAWLTWLYTRNPRLTGWSAVSIGEVNYDKSGQLFRLFINEPYYVAREKRDFGFLDLKTDWEYEKSKQMIFKFGVDVRDQSANYDYQSRDYISGYDMPAGNQGAVIDHIDTLLINMNKGGTRYAAYLANCLRLAESLIMELGVRFDHASYTGDNLWTPRLNIRYDIDARTAVRAGWGYFYQTEGIDEISVGDGERNFYRAEKAEHRLIGLEREFSHGIHLQLEVYEKRYSRLRPEPRNSFNWPMLFPERERDRIIVDRISNNARGIELSLKKDSGGRFSWWLSYTFSKARDSIRDIYFSWGKTNNYFDTVLPVPFDQRHAFYIDLQYRPTSNWQLSAAFRSHTGWPYTDAVLLRQNTSLGPFYEFKAGPELNARYETFLRLDIRLNRQFSILHGRISTYVEILNVFNRENIYSYEYDIMRDRQGFYIDKKPGYWFGRIFTLGISYDLIF